MKGVLPSFWLRTRTCPPWDNMMEGRALVPPPERGRPENAVKAIKDPLQMGRGDSPTLVTAKVTFGPSAAMAKVTFELKAA